MMSLAFGLFTQVSGSGPLGPLVDFDRWRFSAGLESVHSTLQLLYFSWVKSPT